MNERGFYTPGDLRENLNKLCQGPHALTDVHKLDIPLPVRVPPEGTKLLELMQRHLLAMADDGQKVATLEIGDTTVHDSLELWP